MSVHFNQKNETIVFTVDLLPQRSFETTIPYVIGTKLGMVTIWGAVHIQNQYSYNTNPNKFYNVLG